MKSFKLIYSSIAISIMAIGTCSASDSPSLDFLKKDLSDIKINQEKMITNQEASLNKDVLTGGFKNLDDISSAYNRSKFKYFLMAIEKTDKRKYAEMKKMIGNLSDNKYLMSLVQGKYYKDEIFGRFIDSGSTDQSMILNSAILSKINSNQVINNDLFNSVKAQVSADWINGIKVSTRDQLLRTLSMQMSISNLLNYQQLETQRLNSLLNVSKSMDNRSISNSVASLEDKQERLQSSLDTMNERLEDIYKKLSRLKK